MEELEQANNRRSQKQWDLKETIMRLVKEQYRLMGWVVYEPIDEVMEREIILQSRALWN